MFKYLFLISLVSFGVLAHEEVNPVNNAAGTQNIQICKPEVKTEVKYVKVPRKCEVCNKCQQPKVVYKTRYKTKVVQAKPKIVYKTRVKTKKVYVKRKLKKNSLSVIGGASPTDLRLRNLNGTIQAETEYEFDMILVEDPKATDKMNELFPRLSRRSAPRINRLDGSAMNAGHIAGKKITLSAGFLR